MCWLPPLRLHVLLLRIPPIAFILSKLGSRSASWLFQKQDFEIKEIKPCGVCDVVVMAAMEFREDVTQSLL